jgi:SAM-dependent methyltransferase
MDVDSPHLPSRAKALLEGQNKVSTYESTGGAVTAQFASHNLELIPKIPAGSVIHDNASGAGTVSRAILSSSPAPTDVKIYATDVDQVFLDVLEEDVKKNEWPVEVSKQRAEQLSFPDEFFTHSITNIAIFFTGSAGLDGTKEIYRTLKPGGTAIVNCWEHITWFFPIKLVHDATRPGVPYPAPPIGWSDGKQLQKVMKEAGFQEEKWKVERSDAWAKTKDLRAWAEKSWAYLGGICKWSADDEAKWEGAINQLVEILKKQDESNVKTVDGETWLRASQWVVVATK